MDTWGTHVATDTLVGGMFEQQVVMKDCIWANPYLTGGLQNDKVEEYLKMDLAKSPPVDPFYVARRKMSIDHRIGGNPEVSDQNVWKSGLSKNPSLLKIYSHVIWSEVAKKSGLVSQNVVSNLQKAINQRLTDKENQRIQDREIATKKRIQELQGPRNVIAMVGHGRRGTIAPLLETGKYLTLKGYSDCPPDLSYSNSVSRCNTGLNVHSWNSVELIEPLRYERNSEGYMRSVRCFDKDRYGNCITHVGPWVKNGCSLQPYANGNERPFQTPVPSRTVVAMVCADCEIITAGFPSDSTLKCACPGYVDADQSMEKQSFAHFFLPASSFEFQNNNNTAQQQTSLQLNPMKTYKQCDVRWACYPYHGHKNLSSCTSTICGKSNNICISGCGITTLAMVLTFYGHQKITPPVIADLLIEKCYRDDLSGPPGATCNGVSHTAICAVASDFGLTCNVTQEFSVLDSWLEDRQFYNKTYSAPVFAHVRHKLYHECKFTRAGHYVVITSLSHVQSANGTLEKMYHVSDPNSEDPERQFATMPDFSNCQIVGFIRLFPF